MSLNNFAAQFQKLMLDKPRYNLKQVQTENSRYADTAIKSRNCYYTFGAFYSDDIYYSRYCRKCTDCFGLTFCFNCEGCVESTDCTNCYFVSFCEDCRDCCECEFCCDCASCNNCFGCLSLYQKRHCLFNEQLSAEDYGAFRQAIDLRDPAQLKQVRARLSDLHHRLPRLAAHLFRTENCIGDHLSEAANCYQCYDAFKLEDCLYNIECNGNRDCCDLTVCFESELCYSCVQAPLNYNCNFLVHSDSCANSEFCAFSKNLKDCFGCVYLADKQYHILNEPLSRDEYFRKVELIKRELSGRGLYNLSLFLISDYERRRIREETDSAVQDIAGEMEKMSKKQTATCCTKGCGKEFLLIPQELKFYEQKNLPLPAHCPACRHKVRMALRNERALYKRTCGKCGSSVLSTYPPQARYTIYCQDCFWKNIG